MQQVEIYMWCGSDTVLREKTGYVHRQLIPSEDMFQATQRIFDAGLNVMLWHNADDDCIATILVDTKQFQVR